MSRARKIDVPVVRIKRIGTSPNGNPRHEFIDEAGGTFRTKQDAGCAYVVSEWEGWTDEPVRPHRLTLDGRGSVIGIENLADTEQ